MKLKVLASLVLLIGFCMAAYFPLEDESLYCARYGIEEWCSESGFAELEAMASSGELEDYFINELLFEDSLRYEGNIKITDVDVLADIEEGASVTVIYKILNSGDEETLVSLATLDTPEGAVVYQDGELVDADPLSEGWSVVLQPGEEGEIKLQFSEPLYGDIFGYNVNLLINDKIPDNQVTPTGSFEFILPQGAESVECAPTGYTKNEGSGRTTVLWEKTDFVPWTNPFDDLVCRWRVPEAPAGQEGGPVSEEPVQADNGWMIWILVFVLLAGLIYWYARVKR